MKEAVLFSGVRLTFSHGGDMQLEISQRGKSRRLGRGCQLWGCLSLATGPRGPVGSCSARSQPSRARVCGHRCSAPGETCCDQALALQESRELCKCHFRGEKPSAGKSGSDSEAGRGRKPGCPTCLAKELWEGASSTPGAEPPGLWDLILTTSWRWRKSNDSHH